MALANVIVADDPSEARDLARTHLRVYMKTIDDHYRFSDGHLAGLKGYEFYSKMAKTYSKAAAPRDGKDSAKPADAKKKSAAGDLNVTGTPAEALEKLRYIHHLTGASDFLGQFCVGGLSFVNTQRSMKLFAEKVAPVLKNDPAFAPRIDAEAAVNA
jgi:alkanesulfonate monooxygenase SsuD/methylene tetrahydromethanopterin reductase-like flavin-dependent oxidoreductase (luciferase family)